VRDFMTLYIYNEIFAEKSYDYPNLVTGNPVIIDIGANTGLFSLRMKQRYPDSTIYCYEPFLKNFEQLSQNIRLSKLESIEIFQKGVGGRTRTEKLFLNKNNLGGHSLFELEARSNEFVHIDIIGIADLLKDLGQDRIHLIKMDCEGAEYEIIKGINNQLASQIEIILFESTESVYNLNELTDYLKALGFEIEFVEKSCNYVARNQRFLN
jgi:FkbM family methyltransferase